MLQNCLPNPVSKQKQKKINKRESADPRFITSKRKTSRKDLFIPSNVHSTREGRKVHGVMSKFLNKVKLFIMWRQNVVVVRTLDL